jgi:hypothetical protein
MGSVSAVRLHSTVGRLPEERRDTLFARLNEAVERFAAEKKDLRAAGPCIGDTDCSPGDEIG